MTTNKRRGFSLVREMDTLQGYQLGQISVSGTFRFVSRNETHLESLSRQRTVMPG